MSNKNFVIRLKGGLGNQLFIYAFGYALIRKNFNVYFDMKSGFFKDTYRRKPKINELINEIKPANLLQITLYLFMKKFHNISTSLFNCKILTEQDSNQFLNICDDDSYSKYIFIEGYFQSLYYFGELNNEIKSKIKFSELLLKNTKSISDKIIRTNSVSIHVRRKQYDHLLSIDYYNEAMQIITDKIANVEFYIFSDDHEWCKKYFPNTTNYILIESYKDELYDFYLMTKCKHNIIANSSFSWWGAWLSDNNDNKIVIAPLNTQIGMKDFYYPKNWIIV